MSRGFGSALGGGTTDRIQTGLTTALSGKITIVARINRNGTGGNGLGRILDQNSSVGASNTLLFCGVTGILEFGSGFSTQAGIWAAAATTTNVWAHAAVTYDGSSTANAPIIYYNGVPQTVVNTQAAVGTQGTTAANVNIGNRADGGRNWDGLIAEMMIWNDILTSSEINALFLGISKLPLRRSQQLLYCPLFGTQTNEPDWGPSHVTQSITGTLKQNHSPDSLWLAQTSIEPLIDVTPPPPASSPDNFMRRRLLPQLRMRARI